MKLRPYQIHAVESIFDAWENIASTLLVQPTGTGKTVIMAHVVKRSLPRGRSMVLAHREELIFQAASKIQAVTGKEPGIEMAEYSTERTWFARPPVVVATVQTLTSSGAKRLAVFNPMEFGTLLVDEAHHSTASTYRTVLKHFRQNPSLRVLGVTATPDRTDEEALGQIFESVAHVYEIVDAIHEGWLVPIEQRSVFVSGLDLSSVRTTDGDLNEADVSAAMMYEDTLQRIVVPSLELAGKRKSLVFAASVAQAERMCELYNRYREGSARWVYGETPKQERRDLFSDYAKGKFQFLVNVGVATEGFDEPGIEVIVMARPTKSRPLYAQMVGRATRPLPGVVDPQPTIEGRLRAIATSAKPRCEVIDLVGNAGRHRLMSVADILGGNYPEEVVERATAKAKEAGTSVDMLQCLEAAAEDLRKEMEKRKAREASKRAGLKVKANYTTQQVNPFDVLQISAWRERAWDKGKQPSEKMMALLERQGIATQGLTFVQAKQLIVEVTGRWGHGGCSFKQSQILNRYGLPTKVSREQAKAWIDTIAGNKWRMPEQLRSQTLESVEVY